MWGTTVEHQDCLWCKEPLPVPRNVRMLRHPPCKETARYYEKRRNRSDFTEHNRLMRHTAPLASRNEWTRKYNNKVRLRVLEHYGGICARCGETDVKFLALDHVNGGGNVHRIKIGRWGTSFYRWIQTQGFPEGYRIMCHNCNIKSATEAVEKMPKSVNGKATYMRGYRLRVRESVYNLYGGVCTCCGELDPDVLALDHIEGRCGEERPKTSLLFKVYKEKCPATYQLLCFNCNSAKGLYGSCPHALVTE